LTGVPALSAAYTAIFDARFEDVPELIARACDPRTNDAAGPPEACQLLNAVAIWWQIQLDPRDRTNDTRFLAEVDSAIDVATAWTLREPNRAEAWFYLGGAYAAKAQWRALRGERLAAARDGKRIKESLEQAVALDPAMADAYFGLGLYHYYADVAPTVLKMLRWLLLLPGGDREAGLEEMLRARHSGQLVRSEADYQLHVVYLWYEKEPHRAVEFLDELTARHPHNPHFAQAAAEILDFYIDDTPASLARWEALLASAQRGAVAEPHMTEIAARLGIASQLHQLSRNAEALQHLDVVIAAKPVAPHGALARAREIADAARSALRAQ
jgi:tetratricopeptide (TPR) repeat protein